MHSGTNQAALRQRKDISLLSRSLPFDRVVVQLLVQLAEEGHKLGEDNSLRDATVGDSRRCLMRTFNNRGQGPQKFSQPLSEEEPPYQKTAISWNIIRGSGVIELKITDASTYYVAVANVNMREVKCTFSNEDCTFNAMSLCGNSFVLTSPALIQGASVEGWYIRFSYQPRLIGYLISAASDVAVPFVMMLQEVVFSSHVAMHLLLSMWNKGCRSSWESELAFRSWWELSDL
ncbi:unnamed protein product [Arabis nemorensis]|uniref:E3 ubiquitin-protein ligase APD1-4 middle domain-containing protein n=1 Tax=Arabis nemorensis TaxID=586526 RepID=A0A565BML4_9BRAS|nr:unnamed protein product [Arabis nemorensis]